MSEALWLLVAIVVAKVFVLFGAVVPRQLQQALPVRRRLALGRDALLPRVAQEVQGKAAGLALVRPEQRHAQDLLVELERLLGVLDPEHGVVLPTSM